MSNSQDIQGNLNVSRNLTVGSDSKIEGNLEVGHDLRVSGWLEAPNVKGPMKGLFTSETRLKASYPLPEPGWFALVGNTLPATLYVSEGGEWVNTGGTGSLESVNIDASSLVGVADIKDLDGLTDIQSFIMGSGSCRRILKDGNYVVGTLDIFSDNMMHVITQVITTHYVIGEGGITSEHNDSEIHRYHRSYGVMSPHIEKGTWTAWKEG